MRPSSLVSVALAVVPVAVSAAGTLGFALGNTLPNGNCKMQADYEADFDALKSVSTLVRTYSASSCNTAQQILPAAVAKGFKVVLGVWPDTDDAYNLDKTALQSALSDSSNAGAVYAITVGSEALYRGSLTAQALLSKINDMQSTFPSMKIGTADSWNKFQDGTADPIIKGGLKLMYILLWYDDEIATDIVNSLANAFSYWQGQTLANSSHSYLDDLNQAYGHIQTVAGSLDIVEIWNGETGWPTDGGTNYESAMAGTQNAATFYQQGVCAALAWGFNVFYFEAFDEPSKPASVGTNGDSEDETHWGAYTADRVAKFPMSCSN
ncbi:glycoside hydrolase 3 protein [Xylographa carneopallida]|nr:glycoside hydrolase 3 protein [Xylographa carneopallida]